MSETITKTLVGMVAVAVLFWVFWNPSTDTARTKAKSTKTEQVTKKSNKKRSRSKEASKRIADAKKRASNKSSRARSLRNVARRLDPPEGSAAFLVTGSVKAVRLRSEDGEMVGPGIVDPGRYQILSRGAEGITEHGHVVFEAGDRKRIDCDEEGCRPWAPKAK